MPECLFAFSVENTNLKEVVAAGEAAINWEHEKLRNIVGVNQYQFVSSECLAEKNRKLSTCFLIRGLKKLMFDLPREIYLLEVRTRVAQDNPDYDVNYHDLPLGLINHIPLPCLPASPL